MRLTPFEFNGGTYHLLLNGAAMFDIYDQFGSEGSITDHIEGNSREAFEAVCWYLEELSIQGELFRRRQGMDRGATLDKNVLEVELSPLDFPKAKAAVQRALYAGFFREETEPPKEIDKGLQELEKKNGRKLTRAQYLNAATQFLGMPVFDAMILPVGLVLDMEELEIQRRGLRKEEK